MSLLAQLLLGLSRELLCLGNNLLCVADHVEGGLGQRVVLAVEDLLDRLDRLLEGHEATLDTREDLSDGEGLRQETLDLTGTLDDELVLLGQLVHAENGNDVLERLV